MKPEDLKLIELLQIDEEAGTIYFKNRRMLIFDADAMGFLRHELEPGSLIDAPRRHEDAIGPELHFLVTVAPREADALFDEAGAETRIPVRDCDADVWHVFVPEPGRGRRTDTGPPAPTTRPAACAATRPSSCSTRTPGH